MDIFDWADQNPEALAESWLLVGKGPSYAQLTDADLLQHRSMGLNHVALEGSLGPLTMLHVFDADVLESYDDSLLDRVEYLVMPRVPNESYAIPLLAGTFHRPVSDRPDPESPVGRVIQAFAAADRLLTYERDDLQDAEPGAPCVQVGSFSGSTAVDLLSRLGVGRIRLCGIDGGRSYAGRFSELESDTLLDAGQDSFDAQFREIAAIRGRTGVEILPLRDIDQPVVYVGAQKEQGLAHEVLKYSIDKYSSYTPRVYHLGETIDQQWPEYAQHTAGLRQGTPFSLQRFAIPRLNGMRGRAIYVDSDMQVFSDVRSLWDSPIPESGYTAAPSRPEWGRDSQISVMLIDCERAAWDVAQITEALRSGSLGYEELYQHGPAGRELERTLAPEWNSLEVYQAGRTDLIHYTNMRTQPWLSTENPSAWVWCECLAACVESGAIDREFVLSHVERGWVRPSLLDQLDGGVMDPLLLRRQVLRRDLGFLPPHMYGGVALVQRLSGLGEDRPSALQSFYRRLNARLRHGLQRSGLQSAASSVLQFIAKIRRALMAGR